MELDAKGIKHVMSGDKILVPADRRVEAVAGLMYSHILPRNAKDGFDEVLKNINPFTSQDQTQKMWNRGKEATVAQIICDFPEVADARVMIDPTREVHIGASIDPSATVTITMRSGVKASQQLVDAAADVVQGALSSLSRSKIKVVVDGFPRHVHQDDANSQMASDDQQEKIQKAEVRLEDKIKGELSYIPGLMVAVTVKLNTTNETVHQLQYDGKNTLSRPTEEHTKTSETTTPGSGGQEAGVGANVGVSLNNGPAAAPAPAGPTNTQEETTTKNQILPSTIQTDRSTAPGDTTAVAAAVRVPLAYFAAIYSKENPGVKDPTEKQMRGLLDEQLPKIKRDVMMCTNLKAETDIAVETYVDPTPIVVAPQTVTAGVSMALLSGGHIREAVLGVLALVSLFMVSMVVKKGTPVPAVAFSPAPNSNSSQAPMIDVAGDVVGEVSTGVTTLDGLELDDDALRTQQMLDQVSSLVKENPDSAATLVKRWLNRT